MIHKETVEWENLSIRFIGVFGTGPCYVINKDKIFHGFISIEDGLWEYSFQEKKIKINKKPESTSNLPPRNWVFPELINKFYGR